MGADPASNPVDAQQAPPAPAPAATMPESLVQVLAAAPRVVSGEEPDDQEAEEGAAVQDDPMFTIGDVFALVRSLLYGVPIAEQESFREHFLRARMKLALNRVVVKRSPIHGLGVFARRRIEPEELLTLYPGDALRFYPETLEGPSRIRNGVLFGHHLQISEQKADQVMSNYRSYSYDVDGYYALVGFPHLRADPAYLGHLINDGAICPSNSKEDLERYRKDSKAKANATFEGLLDAAVAVVASKRIEKGEEVLVSYGAEFWLTLQTAAQGLEAVVAGN